MNKWYISIKDGLWQGDRPYINCPSIWTTSYFINGCTTLYLLIIPLRPVSWRYIFISKLHSMLHIQSMGPCVYCTDYPVARLDRVLLYSSQPRVRITSMPFWHTPRLNSNEQALIWDMCQEQLKTRITSMSTLTRPNKGLIWAMWAQYQRGWCL